jgi:hypothetical protein
VSDKLKIITIKGWVNFPLNVEFVQHTHGNKRCSGGYHNPGCYQIGPELGACRQPNKNTALFECWHVRFKPGGRPIIKLAKRRSR